MDINDFRGVMSAVILVAFVGLILFTLMGGRNRFRDAADAPFADESDGVDAAAEAESCNPSDRPSTDGSQEEPSEETGEGSGGRSREHPGDDPLGARPGPGERHEESGR